MNKMVCQSLRIALIFDNRAEYLKLGYSPEECDDLPFDGEIKAIRTALESLSHEVIEIPGIKHLVARLAVGDETRWDLAFNMAEGFYGTAREAQVPGILEAYKIPYTFADAQTAALCQDKQKTKIMLQHHGIPTANFIVVGVDEELHFSKIKAAGLSFPVFAKPVAEGSSKGIFGNSRADTYIELEGLVKKLKAQFRAQSILIETFLSGRDITVSILGTGSQSRVIGSLEWARLTNDKKIDRRMNGQSESDFVGLTVRGDHGDKPWIGRIHPLDASDRQLQAAYDVALRTWRVLSCRDAGRVDIRFNTMGETAVPNVLEINPIAGLDPQESFMSLTAVGNGMSYNDLIGQVIDSAIKG